MTLAGTMAHAELPVVEVMDPNHVSSDASATMTTRDGQLVQVRLKVFGSDNVAIAQEAGRKLAPFYYTKTDLDEILTRKGFELYHDRFFSKAFDQVARDSYEKARIIQ